MIPSLRQSRAGFALILVLAFVLLISVVTLAFFSNSLLQRQISFSSANQSKVDLFAQGALDTTVGDLRQEIFAGSTAETIPVTGGTNYWPITAASMVPYRSIPAGNVSNLNLVKQSAYNQPFYTGAPYTSTGPNRAASSTSSGASSLSRSVSTARWNVSLLLPLKTPGSSSDFTPNSFTPPDWIYVDRGGKNPTAISTDILGRYAYCIYDEGGLLDANVAGFPSEMTTANASRKIGASLADLTQTGLTSSNVERLVGYRNYASAQPSGVFPSYLFDAPSALRYFNSVISDTSGFMNVSNSTLYNGNTDQKFGSRQQLINFLLQTLGAKSDTLQYLGTFSRALDQPSFRPSSGRPLVLAASGSPSLGSTYTSPAAGGNDAFGLDDAVNPSFLKVPVTTSFQRRDGTQAIKGEPLVKKRFALNRLCWITYKGPVATLSSGDAIVQQLLTAGISQQLINQGTAANIASYFGLVWDNSNGLWNYGIGLASTHTLGKLSDIQPQGREPDFFEVLKAGLVTGSLGKTSGNSDSSAIFFASTPVTPAAGDIDQYIRDTSTNYQVIQIGANMIDQFDADSYPTHIFYDTRDFYGSESLPYLYRAHVIGLQVAGSSKDAMLLLPEVWNPYNDSGSAATAGPTSFRFLLASSSSTSTQAKGATRCYPTPYIANPFNGSSRTSNPSAGLSPFYSLDSLNSLPPYGGGKTEIDFTLSGSAAAREPTFVGGIQTAYPQNSLTSTMPSSNNLVTASIGVASGIAPFNGYLKDGAVGGTLSYMGVLLGTFANTWTVGVGANAITYPWPQNPPGPTSQPTYYGPLNPTPCDECQTTQYYEANYILQYQDASSVWRTYQNNFAQIPLYCEVSGQHQAGTASATSRYIDLTLVGTRTGYSYDSAQWLSWMDPRTSRFGGMGAMVTRTLNPTTVQQGYYSQSNRYSTGYGMGFNFGTPGSGMAGSGANAPQIGWYPGGWGALTGISDGSNMFISGYYSENITGIRASPQSTGHYFADPDGVVRRGMSGYTGPITGSTVGLPMALLNTPSRPYMLNRPFQSVAELGYVFSGTPWRNLDFCTVESGAAPLLDVFCLNETPDPSALVAGKVNLNTRQPKVLQALLSGSGGSAGSAYKDELNPGSSSLSTELTTTEIHNIAQALITRTTGNAATGTGLGPLENVSELVGKWNKSVTATGSIPPFNIDGSQSYVGFANDLATVFQSTDANTSNIQRLHESALRGLAASGQTRVWNLLIDVVAQTGKYRSGETALDNLIVDGERRYWLHIAIDRFTGKVLDEQLEHVKE